MHRLRNEIYWLTDQLRRMELFSQENTDLFREKKEQLIALAKIEAEATKRISNLSAARYKRKKQGDHNG